MSLSRPAYTLRTPRIRANSPYARGLWLALAGNHYDLARRKFIERYGLSLTPTVGGVGVRAPNVYTEYMVAGTPPVSANASMLSVFVPNATVGNESLLDADGAASGVRNFQFRTSGATLQLIGFNTAKNSFTATTGTLFSKAGDLCVAIGVLNGTEVVAKGRSGTTVVSATATMTGVPSGIGGRVVEVIGRAATDAAQASNHTLLLAAMWLRALSDDEQQRLLDDPWSVFQRRVKRRGAIVAGVTLDCTVGNAVAAGSQANVSAGTTINASVGNAAAAGSQANISAGTTINASVGNAVAEGAQASITSGTTLDCTVGNAVAAGAQATISAGTTINAGVGNAVAAGVQASITTGFTLECTVGNAVAAGVQAGISIGSGTVTIACAVGNAVAAGVDVDIWSADPLLPRSRRIGGEILQAADDDVVARAPSRRIGGPVLRKPA